MTGTFDGADKAIQDYIQTEERLGLSRKRRLINMEAVA